MRKIKNTVKEEHNLAHKTAYLTFDDGPSVNTDSILAIFKKYNVKATFFVNGNQTDEGKRLYRRIQNGGHILGNHTFSHNYSMIYSSIEAFKKDTERLSKLLEHETGKRPMLLRFPGGSNNRVSRHFGGLKIMKQIIEEMKKEGYVYTDWNVSSTDAALPVQTKNEIIRAVLNGSRGKKEIIVLMHDDALKTMTVKALPEVVKGLIQQGFHFSVLSPDSFKIQFLK